MNRYFTLHRNVYLWYATTFFSFAAFILPVWLIFGTNHLGLSNTQAIILGVVPYGLSAFLEVPTGAWADRYGRIRIYRIGVSLYALALASYLFFSDFYILLAFQVMGSLGLAMQSGPLEALVHDSLDQKNKDSVYKKVSSNRLFILFASRALTVFVGGMLYAIDPRLPFGAAAIFNMIGVALSFFLKEVRLEQPTAQTNWSHIGEALAAAKRHPRVIAVIALLGMFQLSAEALFVLYQPYFQSIGIDIKEFGVYYFVISVLSAIGALIVGRFLQRYSVFTAISCMMLTVVISVLLLVLGIKELLYFAVGISAVSFGFTMVILHTTIQERISSKYQATVLSFGSVSIMGAFFLTTIAVGVLLDATNIGLVLKVLLTLSVLSLGVSLLGYPWFKRYK